MARDYDALEKILMAMILNNKDELASILDGFNKNYVAEVVGLSGRNASVKLLGSATAIVIPNRCSDTLAVGDKVNCTALNGKIDNLIISTKIL